MYIQGLRWFRGLFSSFWSCFPRAWYQYVDYIQISLWLFFDVLLRRNFNSTHPLWTVFRWISLEAIFSERSQSRWKAMPWRPREWWHCMNSRNVTCQTRENRTWFCMYPWFVLDKCLVLTCQQCAGGTEFPLDLTILPVDRNVSFCLTPALAQKNKTICQCHKFNFRC